jgi:hypothetical protein
VRGFQKGGILGKIENVELKIMVLVDEEMDEI